MGMEKPKYSMWQNSWYMIKLAWDRQKIVLVLCIILAVVSVASNLVGLFITPTILGAVEDAVPIRVLLTVIIGFASVQMILGAINSYVTTNTLFGRISVRSSIVAAIHDKFAKTSYPNTEDQSLRNKLDRANMAVSGNNQATEAIWNTLTEIVQNLAGFAIYLTLLSSLHPIILGVTLATAVAGYYSTNYINGWGYRHRDEEAEYSRRMRYISGKAEDYTIAKDIRIFGMGNWLESVYDSSLRLYHAFIVRGEKVYIWANVVDVTLSLLRNGVAYVFLIKMTLRDGLSASQFLLYFATVGGFTAWISGILSSFSTLHRQSLDISNVREFLETPEPFKFEDGEPIEPDNCTSYVIELRHVSFRYPGADEDTLSNVNLTIRAGEKLAVVGLNGAGKTTLVKLVCGFYDPTSGCVLLNGRNIKDFNRRDYYRHFAAVFQQFSLMAGTVAVNVAQVHENMNMEKVRECIDRAGLTDKVLNLPQGYGTHLGRDVWEDGVELSGGETQRLMLARALYKDAPIIVLDEPTAALDPIAESDIYNKYNQLTKDRTSIYISHRLASTRFCDRIVFLEEGGIAEEGTHDSLLKKGGGYAELFEIQSRYYREGGVEDADGQRFFRKDTA